MTHYWFVSKYRQNSKLALIASLLAFVVILLGAYTRLNDAGLACPDWPHCYGYITAPFTPTQLEKAAQDFPLTPVNTQKAWTEMTHRYFAGTEGILIFILGFSILLNRKIKDGKAVLISLALFGLLAVQVILGMLTVTEKLQPFIVLSHLLAGVSILCLLWWIYLDLPLRDDVFIKKSNSPLVFWFWLGLIIVILQIALGGWVSSHYAALACVDFPYCNGQVLPPMQWNNLNNDHVTIHMLHRIGAVITATYLLILSLFLIASRAFRAIALLIMSLVALQVTLGILNIVWFRPVWVALIHHAVAQLLLLTLVTSLVKAYYHSWNHPHGSFKS